MASLPSTVALSMFAIPNFDIIAAAGPEVKFGFDRLACG
jgi:hypothetical protein